MLKVRVGRRIGCGGAVEIVHATDKQRTPSSIRPLSGYDGRGTERPSVKERNASSKLSSITLKSIKLC